MAAPINPTLVGWKFRNAFTDKNEHSILILCPGKLVVSPKTLEGSKALAGIASHYQCLLS